MAKIRSKKQLILELYQARRLQHAGLAELRAIEAEIRSELGPAEDTSLSYIASVLRQAGVHVDYQSLYLDVEMEEPYASRLKDLLHFADLASAESSLRKLDAAYGEYQKAPDHRGMQLVRALAKHGKDRAASLAANPRVSPEKRREKKEIASWFRTWIETPDLFLDWLDLRKQAEEFQQWFGAKRESAADASSEGDQ